MRSCFNLLLLFSLMGLGTTASGVVLQEKSEGYASIEESHSEPILQADSDIRVRRMKSLLDQDQMDGEAFLARVEELRKRLEGGSGE